MRPLRRLWTCFGGDDPPRKVAAALEAQQGDYIRDLERRNVYLEVAERLGVYAGIAYRT